MLLIHFKPKINKKIYYKRRLKTQKKSKITSMKMRDFSQAGFLLHNFTDTNTQEAKIHDSKTLHKEKYLIEFYEFT